MRLEDLTRGSRIKGIFSNQTVTIVDVQDYGGCVEVTYKDEQGVPGTTLIYPEQAAALEIVKAPWGFEADGEDFRLVAEAKRIKMAYLFDPHLAVHTSLIEPLPHQISAVYEIMLKRQPLRFLLADDPGAGKTVMAGLLIKELMMRGDVKRCLICTPGSLTEQWMDELETKFQLRFELLTRQSLEQIRRGNPFQEKDLLICRLDQLSRNDEMLSQLEKSDWDLIIVDEAHKMSASFYGGEVNETKRFRLGKLFSRITRHFLLMTATPHNGKEEDFQLFLSLLDQDRFEGKFRTGVHKVEIDDIMRRLTKEQLLKFDGTRLFPERHAYTVTYPLSKEEKELYDAVTSYVNEQWNRIDQLGEKEQKRRTVGFALTILQRRLASSPEAIYQSLYRRRCRLEEFLKEEKKRLKKNGKLKHLRLKYEDQLEDLYELAEAEQAEDEIAYQATLARTISELETEIEVLKNLEKQARRLRQSGKDRKWEELSMLLQSDKSVENSHLLLDEQGNRRKLVIFTEHRDTLNYLVEKIRTLLGRPEAVVMIHGSMDRDSRKQAQEAFNHDKNVLVLVATDAAGEGINLHRAAHLMVNYDLPWNPNRLEQRFGRIHRIGQTRVCHLWNLVSVETREGEVFAILLKKLETVREALNDKVFDILGKVFDGNSLRDLLIQAIRYGDRPDIKARLLRKVNEKLEHDHLIKLISEKALIQGLFDRIKVQEIRREMERASARRLQPHFIASFFVQAFRRLGGTIREREPRRYEIVSIPQPVRQRARDIDRSGLPARYLRICFDKTLTHLDGKPHAEFVCPGHPLLDAVVELILEKYGHLMKQGTVLVDERDDRDDREEPRLMMFCEQEIHDGIRDKSGQRVVSRRMHFVEMVPDGQISPAGYAPYLDYRPLSDEEKGYLPSILDSIQWERTEMEHRARQYMIRHLVPEHLKEVELFRKAQVAKIRKEVRARLETEIRYWDKRAAELRAAEKRGKKNAKLNSQNAQRRADDLQVRLEQRMIELDLEEKLQPKPPNMIGTALIIPGGMLRKLKGENQKEPGLFGRDRKMVERIAMETIMEIERQKGFQPVDVSVQKLGYDIESWDPETGKVRFLEVKGRVAGATTVTVTRNEILTAVNRPDAYWLAVVEVEESKPKRVVYIRQPFTREPDFAATSVNYDLRDLMSRGEDETWRLGRN
ncbi:helicase-related protein [Staphylospora marina]|uniref:helicase-related protein n=1 Tax=Staphylospora marina TaxID=2490858 RepID=UPI0019D29315|nr:helicase-related protein [Staphylospora marina]